MKKLDLRKKYRSLYVAPAKKVVLLDVPELQFAMINGVIEPGQGPSDSPGFRDALQALYGISYTLKFMSKQRKVNPIDYPVMALEALWWVSRGSYFDPGQPWKYTAMILQPEHITPKMFSQAIVRLKEKKPNPAIARVRLRRLHEGLCIQALHIGPYAQEPRTLKKMDDFAAEQRLALRGRHHEIYLGDPMRAAPEKLRTVLRHPVRQKG
ncbi:MAG: GyrI-like domain-containing protein [Anaerolineales bacterium]|nr:GyrI-like domain-containing protein [Anaerolineales bacterium]